jgi:hypothetical protein
MTPIYKKVGRRYKEIGVYENEQYHYQHGSHLVVSREGSVITRFNIDPANAQVEAALEYVRDAMVEAMRKACELTPDKRMNTPKEMKAIKAFYSIAGPQSLLKFEGVSMNDIVDAGIKILKREVSK